MYIRQHSKNFLALISFCGLLFASCSCSEGLKHYTVEVLEELPHSTDAYTQGLFFQDGTLYESCGEYGKSHLRTVKLQSGESIIEKRFPNDIFLEGSIIFKDKLYLLTWVNKVAYIVNPLTLETERTVEYPREGWGLTTDGVSLIASDGSSKLFFLDENLSVKSKLQVRLNGKSVRNLNELEYIDGQIWANIYLDDRIVIINPHNGEVTGVIDCKGLLPDSLRTKDTDVLNGIAYDKNGGSIYLTGKNWPKMYKIRLVQTN